MTLGQLGAGLVIMGWVLFAGHWLVVLVETAGAQVAADQALEVLTTASRSPWAALLHVSALGLFAGSVLLAAGLWVRRATAVWVPVVLLLYAAAGLFSPRHAVNPTGTTDFDTRPSSHRDRVLVPCTATARRTVLEVTSTSPASRRWEQAMTNILIAYATKNGSTREVAEAIGAVARVTGADFEVMPARAVTGPLPAVDLVIVGAPLYSGRWHRDAHRFLRRHERELATVPVAVFALGPRDNDASAWQRSWQQFHRALAKRSRVRPLAIELFGGADPAGRKRPERRDLRDWTEIGAWARKVLAMSGAVGTHRNGAALS